MPKIKHATVTEFYSTGYKVKMNKGFGFYFKNSFIDEDGNIYEPTNDEIILSMVGYFPKNFNFDNDNLVIKAVQ